MNPESFDWQRFHAYRVFNEFLERFVIQRKSYVTLHLKPLDLVAAFEDIRERFVAGSDESKASFGEKVKLQFEDAPDVTKIVFANIEYLWAMPMMSISPETKQSYALRWFRGRDQVVEGNRYFFGHPHTIADPGPWYLRNKYWELVALMRVLSLVTDTSEVFDLVSLKRKIAEICHLAVYGCVAPEQKFSTRNFCGVHCALMHLADPERYESIISASHREQICAVFEHVVVSPSPDKEVLLKQIRATLYDSYGNGEEPDRKNRWFFYSKDVQPLWIDKKSKRAQRIGSAVFDVRIEEDAVDLEGGKEEVRGYRIRRSGKLVKAAKLRDRYTCRACGFHFEDQIVHVHHLDPISELRRPQETRLKDLVTLCPTCHYLAHYWIRKNSRYKGLESLLRKLCPRVR